MDECRGQCIDRLNVWIAASLMVSWWLAKGIYTWMDYFSCLLSLFIYILLLNELITFVVVQWP